MTNKQLHILLLILSSALSFAQSNIPEGMYLHIDGVIQIHEDAQLGIHTHLENDGTFDENEGFTGFYSDTEILTVYGENRPIFNNVDVAVINNLELYNSVGVKGEFQFIDGKIITPRNQIAISLDYIDYDWHIGEDNLHHVDGYSSNIGQNKEFIFPIGDSDKYREMILPNQPTNSYFEGAYFYDDPESIVNDNDLSEISFDRFQKIYFVTNVSEYEFWDLNGSTEIQVTLTWDEDSNIPLITDDLKELIVTGWNIENLRWESLGNVNYSGNMNSGKITSIGFVPDAYDIITFAAIRNKSNNFYISPSVIDGYNDVLFFDELTEYDRGALKIFNRWGNIVYESDDYEQHKDGDELYGDFNGISNGRATVRKNKKLPTGTYFYELEYGNQNFEHLLTGWIYIVND